MKSVLPTGFLRGPNALRLFWAVFSIIIREVLIALKVFGRMLAILVAAILSVVAVQRLVLKLYTDIGKHYILIDDDTGKEA